MDPKFRLVHEVRTLGLEHRRTKIPSAGLGIFPYKRFVVSAIIGHIYGTIIYQTFQLGQFTVIRCTAKYDCYKGYQLHQMGIVVDI